LLSAHNLGYAQVVQCRWYLSPADLAKRVREAIYELNPEGRGLIDMEGDDTETRNRVRYAKLLAANQKPYRETTTGEEILGDHVPVFRKSPEGYHLVRWFVYADGQCQLGPAGELLPFEEVSRMLMCGLLTTAVPDDSWVTIDELGQFRTGGGRWYVDAGERIPEAHDLRAVLNGQPSSSQRCMKRLAEYERDPSEARREALRQAYEAVPAHLRRYCGDMDYKDAPIRWILYG
jgi:hypothetical protein